MTSAISASAPDIFSQLAALFDRFTLNPWKIAGLLGAAMFGARWIVQAIASRKAGRPVVPALFWVFSVGGSLLQVLYFTVYRVDSVGILNSAPPFLVACYNVYLLRRGGRKPEAGAAA